MKKQNEIISNSNSPSPLGKDKDGAWISSKTICEKLGFTNQTLQYHRTKNWMFREANCNDGSKYEILLSSLLPEQIAKYNQHCIIHEHEENVDYKSNLTDKQKEIALAKDSVLRLYLKFIDKSSGSILHAKERFVEVFNQGFVYPHLFKVLGEINRNTIDTHWLPIWNENGKDPFVLAPKYRGREDTVTEEEAKILRKYFLTAGKDRPIRQDARYAIKDMIIKNVPNIKSIQTYIRWLENFKKNNMDVYELCREGRKSLEDKMIKPVKIDKERIGVGDVIVGDGHKLNFEIIDPLTGCYRRMNLILFYDMYSDLPLGWDISLTEDTESITIALYRAILRLGKFPKVIKLDNGKAFRSKFLNGMEADLEECGIVGLFERLGCKVSFALPYNAKAKPIERFFRTFSELEMRIPTYCGTSIENKPPRMLRNEKLHKRIYDNILKSIDIDLFTAHQLIAAYFDEYAERMKTSGRLKGKKPLDIFRAGMGEGIDKMQLIWLMMEKKNAQCYADGFHLFGTNFYDKKLYGFAGQKFSVRYDILNKDFIFVMDRKNNIFCKAVNDRGVHPAAHELGNETDVRMLNEAMALKRQQYNSTYERAAQLLNYEMAPSIEKKIKEAQNLNQLENKEEQTMVKIKPANIFGKIKPELPAPEKQSNIFYKKSAEG